jgi:hypothetical protein
MIRNYRRVAPGFLAPAAFAPPFAPTFFAPPEDDEGSKATGFLTPDLLPPLAGAVLLAGAILAAFAFVARGIFAPAFAVATPFAPPLLGAFFSTEDAPLCMAEDAVRMADAPVFIADLPTSLAERFAWRAGLLELIAAWPVLTTASPAFMAAAVVPCAVSTAASPARLVDLSVAGAISLIVSPIPSIVEPAISSAAPTTRAAVPATLAATSITPPSSSVRLEFLPVLVRFRLAIRSSLIFA